jgi:hypothetical protein
MIYDYLNYSETLFLSLTCRHFFILAQLHLYHLAAQLLQNEQSAGDRIVCVGNYTMNIPVTLIPRGATQAHGYRCAGCMVEGYNFGGKFVTITEATEASPEIIEFPLYKYARSHFASPGSDVYGQESEGFGRELQQTYERQVRLVFNKQRDEEYHRLVRLGSDPQTIINRGLKPAHPAWKEAERWTPRKLFAQMHDQFLLLPFSRTVLRNLTTQEYVIDCGLGFTSTLYAQICYSNDPRTNMKEINFGGEELHQGPWAGHRFEITNLDDVEEDRKQGKEWRNVTRRIRQKLKGIYDAELGEGKYTLAPPTDDSTSRQMLLEFLL